MLLSTYIEVAVMLLLTVYNCTAFPTLEARYKTFRISSHFLQSEPHTIWQAER